MGETGFQQMVLSPMLSVGQKSEALGEFILESGQKWVWGPSDIGLPGINRPPSVPSSGLLPEGSRMSVFFLAALSKHCVWDDV